jgi:putative DNA primase/helicase
MGTVEDIQKLIADRVAEEAAGGEPEKKAAEITSRFIWDCLQANELGDAQLFIALNRGLRLYNQTSTEWMRWAGHHWEIDRGSADAMAAMEGVVGQYLQEAKALVDKIAKEDAAEIKRKLIDRQKRIYKRVEKLRSVHGCNNCLTFTTRCHDRMVVQTDDFDKDPWALAFQNGVVDLRTGELLPGNPKDMLMKACPHDWTGIDTPCPTWEQALLDIMDGSQEMADFCARLFGYAITGLSTEHILPVFWGKGRNGKSMLVETIRYVMGTLASPIRSEMLLDQSFMKSSAGPSPDIMSLKGLRIAFANETDEGRRISPSQVKLLTGADTMVARNPHDRYETRFDPTHTLFLLTNNQPQAPADDFAFWKRIVLVPFQVSFVSEPKAADERMIDKFLGEKLKQEASGILAWLVRGCLAWQQTGLDFPSLVSEATGDYRRREDMLADFIDETCQIDSDWRESAARMYDAFRKWFEANYSKKIPSQKRFGTLMSKKFERQKDGVYFYRGLKLLPGAE